MGRSALPAAVYLGLPQMPPKCAMKFPPVPAGMPVMAPSDSQNFIVTDILDGDLLERLNAHHARTMSDGITVGTTVFVVCGMAHPRPREGAATDANDRKVLVWMGLLSHIYKREKLPAGHLKVRFEAEGNFYFPEKTVFVDLPDDTPFCLAQGITMPSDAPEAADSSSEASSEDSPSGAEAEDSEDNGEKGQQQRKKKKTTKRGARSKTVRPTAEAMAERLERAAQHDERVAIIQEAAQLGKKFLVDVSHHVCVPLATSRTVPEMVRHLEAHSFAGPFTIQKLFLETGHVAWDPKPLAFLNPIGAKGPKKKKVCNNSASAEGKARCR